MLRKVLFRSNRLASRCCLARVRKPWFRETLGLTLTTATNAATAAANAQGTATTALNAANAAQATANGAAEMIDPRPYAQGGLADVYAKYPHLGPILPALGYYPEQLRDLEATIEAVPADVVLSATPSSLADLIHVSKPVVKVSYEMVETGEPRLSDILREFVRNKGLV